MNQEKVPYNKIQGNGPQEEIPEIHSSEPSASDIEKAKKLYLPISKANNSPSEDSIEDANVLNYSKPNTLL